MIYHIRNLEERSDTQGGLTDGLFSLFVPWVTLIHQETPCVNEFYPVRTFFMKCFSLRCVGAHLLS